MNKWNLVLMVVWSMVWIDSVTTETLNVWVSVVAVIFMVLYTLEFINNELKEVTV